LTAKNDITGDLIKSKTNSKEYEDNFDRVFRCKVEDSLCKICGKELSTVKECAWTSCPKWLAEWDEERADRIGQNGNEGLHYEENSND
jgi:hypothetical protein